MVARRIATKDEHQVSMLDVIQHRRGGPTAEGRLQGHGAGLRAEVTAMADVVSAEDACEELEQKACFVGAAATKVPKGLGRRERFQLRDKTPDGFIPVDELVGLAP